MPRSPASPRSRRRIPALAQLADGIGDPQVRNRGTIGGSIANNDPGGRLSRGGAGAGRDGRHQQAQDRRRTISSQGMFETALEPGEIVTAVELPGAGEGRATRNSRNPASRYAMVGVFVAKTARRRARRGDRRRARRVPLEGDGSGADARLRRRPRSTASRCRRDGLNSDIHASAEYRAHLVGVMAKRAVAAAG